MYVFRKFLIQFKALLYEAWNKRFAKIIHSLCAGPKTIRTDDEWTSNCNRVIKYQSVCAV